MKELIFKRLKELKMDLNHVWYFQDWNRMRWSLEPEKRKEFEKYMEELINSGFFKAEQVGEGAYQYKLTEKGYNELYEVK